MPISISSSIIACLKSFNQFVEDIKHPQEANVVGLDARAWEDELGRLRLWAANIGASQTGQSSLDFRLRDASHVRQQIKKLLQGLLRRLQDARDVLADDEESNDDEAADDTLGGEDRKSEIQELQESLATNINCLFQMSILVRKPAQHDVYLGCKCADVAAFELSDYNHVRDKYPKADDVLVKRLGNAITRRRKYLKYRERHAAKDLQGVRGGETITLGTIPDFIVEDFEQLNTSFDDKASNKGISQTSHAPTLLSEGNVAIPRPPKTSLGGVPFECPYCFYVIIVDRSRSWNKHVFQDLQPYVCISPTCTTPYKLYSTRREWLHHSKKAHPAAMTDDDTPNESTQFAACPLCKEEIDSVKLFDRHLAHHLQQLALFILPVDKEDSDVGEDQDAESSSDAESAPLAASHDGSESPKSLPVSPVEYPAAIEVVDSSYGKQEHDNDEEKKEERRERIIVLIKEISDKQRLLGPEHRATLTSMAELAEVYSLQEEYEKAAPLVKHVIEVRKELLGEEHPETLLSMTQLAKVYQAQQRWKDAGGPYQQALNISMKRLGPDHAITLRVVWALGHFYSVQGRLAEAEDMYQQAVEGYETSFGPDHELTLTAAQGLGRLYEKMGMLAEAEMMYQRTLYISEKRYGPDHELALSSAQDLGGLCEAQGELAEAEVLYQQALKGSEKSLGPNHQFTLSVAQRLGKFYEKEGNLRKAEEMYQRDPHWERPLNWYEKS